MGVNKVEFGGDTLIDLTSDTVTSNNLLNGATAHSADGEPVVGNVITHEVLDTLESDSTEDALSANKGKELKGLVDNIPAWAKETEKPAYNAEEVSAKDKDGNDSTVQAELNVLRSSNSETVDARVGADGTEYPTLKNRLDAERKTSIIIDADGWLCTEGD